MRRAFPNARRLVTEVLTQRIQRRSDLIRVETPARQEGIQPPSSREVIQLGQRLPFLFCDAMDGRGWIDTVVLHRGESLIGDVAPDSLPRKLLLDQESRCARPQKPGPRELSGEVGVIQQLLIAQSTDDLFDIRRVGTLLEQPSPQLHDRSRAESEQLQRCIVDLAVHAVLADGTKKQPGSDPRLIMGVSGSHNSQSASPRFDHGTYSSSASSSTPGFAVGAMPRMTFTFSSTSV